MIGDAVFAGRTALLFGGAKGIGEAVARAFAERGANVVIADIDGEAADRAAAAITAQGGRAVGRHADVLHGRSIADAAAWSRAQFGAVDIVMNNVGAMLNGHPQDIPMREWQRMMDLNYFATVRSLDVLLPDFLARGSGHIVNTASFAGLYPYAASRLPYAAAKGATIALSQSLAIYLEPQGIRVSCFIPGPVATGIMASMTAWSADCPMRGPGSTLAVKSADEAATALADGMAAGKIMIASDEAVWDIVRRWADSPDAFIRDRIAAFRQGDAGTPQMPAALAQSLRG